MPDPTTAGGETPPAESTTSTTATTGTVTYTDLPPAGTTTGTTTTGEEPFDKDRAMTLIAKLREEAREAKAAAKDGQTAKERLAAIEAEKLTEAERLAKERDDALAKAIAADTTLREQAIRLAVYGQRDALGLSSPDLAVAALDRSKVEFDDAGQPTNIADLLGQLIEREPVLRAKAPAPNLPSTDGGSGGGTPPSLTADELDAAAQGGMSAEQYQAAKARLGGGNVINVIDAATAVTTKG